MGRPPPPWGEDLDEADRLVRRLDAVHEPGEQRPQRRVRGVCEEPRAGLQVLPHYGHTPECEGCMG